MEEKTPTDDTAVESCITMEEQMYKTLQPEQHLSRFLDYKIRPDGRTLCEPRMLSICPNIMKQFCLGSAAVSAGHSRYIAGVTGSIVSSQPNRPKNQFISVSVEFPSTCGVGLDAIGRKVGYAPDLSTQLTQIFQNPDILDPHQFTIAPETAFWYLHVNVICLEYDGNRFDHALLCAVSALETTRLPDVHWNDAYQWWQFNEPFPGSTITIPPQTNHPPSSSNRLIQFKSRPISITLSHLLQKVWVLDATSQEELHASSLTIYKLEGSPKQPFMILRDGGSPIHLSSQLPHLIPLIHQAFCLIEQHYQRARNDLLTHDQWEMCRYDEPLVDEALKENLLKEKLKHLAALPPLTVEKAQEILHQLSLS